MLYTNLKFLSARLMARAFLAGLKQKSRRNIIAQRVCMIAAGWARHLLDGSRTICLADIKLHVTASLKILIVLLLSRTLQLALQ